MSKTHTTLITAGRGTSEFGEVNPPTYRASTVLFDDFEAFSEAYYGRRKPGYGRQGNPTSFALADALTTLVNADYTLLTPSGLQAITLSLLAFLQQDDHVVMVDSVYGPSRHFCDHMLKNLGVTTTYIPAAATIDDLHHALTEKTKVVFLEAPGSLTFEMHDIKALCALAKQHGCITMMDYTWATPLYIKPFALGIDIAIQAVTKYIAGHSDVIMGAVSCLEAHKATLYKASYHMGNYVSGDECSLTLRGMRTAAIRLDYQYQHALRVATWLQQQEMVAEVLYPPLREDAGHHIWKEQMSGGAALFAVVFDAAVTREQVKILADSLKFFGMGFSWGGYESLVVPFKPKEIRSFDEKWGDDPWCLRVHIGLEDVDDLMQDLENGLNAAQ